MGLDDPTQGLSDLRGMAHAVFSALKHRPWQSCYRMFELNQDLPYAFAATCHNCHGKTLIGDGTFQTVIKVSHLAVKPPVYESSARPILEFQDHTLIKHAPLRKILTRYNSFYQLPMSYLKVMFTLLICIHVHRLTHEGISTDELMSIIHTRVDREPNIAVIVGILETIAPAQVGEVQIY